MSGIVLSVEAARAFDAQIAKVRDYLKSVEISITREAYTGDGSRLFSCLDNDVAIDVYPDGELVLMIKAGEETHVYELDWDDVHLIDDIIGDHHA